MIHEWLFNLLYRRIVIKRPPNKIIIRRNGDYLWRWHLTPFRDLADKNRFWKIFPNIYLHKFLHDDDDFALHDHPWFNASYVLKGSYMENIIRQGGVHVTLIRRAGDVVFRLPWAAHRIEQFRIEDFSGYTGEVSEAGRLVSWSLFFTGPVMRHWGFHCPKGWRPWEDFIQVKNNVQIQKTGCD